MPSPILAETTATTIPTALGDAFTFMIQKCSSMIGIVTDNPVLCLGIAMWCAGGAIGLFKRLV